MNTKNKNLTFGLLYILPSLVLISFFKIIPIFMNVYYSFTDYNIIQSPNFIGIENYIRLIEDPYIKASIINTILFTVLTVPLQTIISLLIAVLIAQYFRNAFGGFIKSTLFIPVIASTVLIGTLWSLFLSPFGVINETLKFIGLNSVNWLGSQNIALLSVSLVTVWKNIGYFLVIFYAGIMNVPRSLYEAADLDGANAVQKFLKITLPSIAPITFLVVTLGTIWSFQVFDLVYTMTSGGPGLSTVTLVLTIYNTGFKSFNMGYASTIALLMLVFVLIISLLQKVIFKDSKEG